MSAQRFLAFVLIGLQAAALGLQAQTLAFPLVVSAVAAWGMVSRRRVELNDNAYWRLAGLTAACFFLKYLVAPHDVPLDRMFIRTPLALAAGQCLLVIQAAHFFLKRADGKARSDLPRLLPGLGVAALICFAAVRVNDHERLIYQVLVVSFVLFTPLYFRAATQSETRATEKNTRDNRRGPVPREVSEVVSRGRQRGRSFVGALSLVAVAVVGWLAAGNLYRYEHSLEQLLGRLLAGPEQRTGYSDDGGLGSVTRRRDADAGAVALIVEGPQRPGYLRGKAFDEFRQSRWRSTVARLGAVRSAEPPEAVAARAGARPVFLVSGRPAANTPQQAFEIWPAERLEETTFIPVGTTHLAVDAQGVLVDRHGILDASGAAAGRPYVAFCRQLSTGLDTTTLPPMPAPAHAAGPPPDDAPQSTSGFPAAQARDRTLSLPGRWSSDAATTSLIEGLSQRIFRGCRTPRDKIAAVERFFQENFRYSPDVNIPTGEDPLLYFLRSRPPAYCEYFASAAALLLRTRGVPTRYVTGFVANERQRFGGYWVARNRDAHAWAEAWIDGEGWMLVEATPTGGLPDDASPAALVGLWEFLRDGLRRFRTRLSREGPRVIFDLAVRALTSPPGLTLAAVLAAVLLWRRRRHGLARTGASADPALRALARLLRRMDAGLHRHGWQRAASETLHDFADRLEQASADQPGLLPAAAWYRRYAAVRYGPAESSRFQRLHELPNLGHARRGATGGGSLIRAGATHPRGTAGRAGRAERSNRRRGP